MEALVKELQGRVEDELSKIDPLRNAVKGYDNRCKIVKNSIIELKRHIAAHPFADQAAEIHCFKHVLPAFFSQYFYFVKVYNAERKRIISSKETFHHFLEDELKKLEVRLIDYGDFCHYYYAGSTKLDSYYYTRDSWESWPEDQSVMPDEYCALGSYKASWIMADERYRQYLYREIQGPESTVNDSERVNVVFKGSKSAAAELSIALTAAKILYFDDQPGSLVQVNKWVENFLHVDLNNIHSIDRNNRKRKKMATPFLNMLIAKYNSRSDQLLEK
jgi:hypothetical protein